MLKGKFSQTSLPANEVSEAISGRDCFGASRLAMTLVDICAIFFLSVWGGEIGLAQVNCEDLYLAKRAFNDGFYDIALKHFQKHLQEFPEEDNAELQILISRCYLNLEKFSQGLQTLQKVLDLPESDFHEAATYWSAQTYFAAEDYENALNFFEQLIEDPASNFLPESYYYRASCFYRRNQFNQALTFYKKFNEKFPKHELREKSAFRLGQCSYNVKDYSRAEKEFKRFTKNFSESTQLNSAIYYLGEIEYILGNFNKAAQYYTEAAEVFPKSKVAGLAKYARGWTYLKQELYQEALDEFNNLNRMPGFGQALEDAIIFGQARAHAGLQNYTEAIRMYEQIISQFSHSCWYDDAYFWKGQALDELARYSEAARTYEQAIEQFAQKIPDKKSERPQAIYEREDVSTNLLPNLRYNLGWTYARMKRYAQAISQFEQVFKESDERFLKSGACSRIGDIYLEQEDTTRAIEYYDSVLNEFADTYYADYAQYQLGVALSREKRLNSAVLAFNTLIANFPESKFLDQAHYQIGAIYFRQGNFDQAKEQLENLIQSFPKSQLRLKANFLRACAYYNSKDYPQAKEAFAEVLRGSSAEGELKMKAQYQIAFCFYQMGKEERTLKEFKEFLSLYPAAELTADVLFWLGQYYYRHSSFTEAQENFTKIAQSLPGNEMVDDALFWQAKTLFKQRKEQLALETLKNLQSNYPDSQILADVLLLKGDILKEQKKLGQAQEVYKKVGTEFKETDFARVAHRKRAQILQEEELLRQAIKAYSQGLGSSSDDLNAQIQFSIAQCYHKLQDFSQAKDEYLKVGYLYPSACAWARRAQIACAEIFEKQKQWEEAKGIYEKLAGNEGNPEAEFARQRLKAYDQNSKNINNH